eukprot:14016591-Alexandrium_andersonii.AAC.1
MCARRKDEGMRGCEEGEIEMYAGEPIFGERGRGGEPRKRVSRSRGSVDVGCCWRCLVRLVLLACWCSGAFGVGSGISENRMEAMQRDADPSESVAHHGLGTMGMERVAWSRMNAAPSDGSAHLSGLARHTASGGRCAEMGTRSGPVGASHEHVSDPSVVDAAGRVVTLGAGGAERGGGGRFWTWMLANPCLLTQAPLCRGSAQGRREAPVCA